MRPLGACANSAESGAAGPSRRLVLFAKLPRPGRVKTRLTPALGREGAARLYRAFLDDMAVVLGEVEVERRELWLAGDGTGRAAMARRYPELEVRVQHGGDLGERLVHAFDTAFEEGDDLVVIVGSDHPSLPPSHLAVAFRHLREAELILGPTRDGGYYAVGLGRTVWPEAAPLFRDVPWSTPGVLDRTRRAAETLELSRRELPEWYDVDTPEDLDRLRADVRAGSRTGRALAGLAGSRRREGEEAGG